MDIAETLGEGFVAYSTAVNFGRSFLDDRDGLKVVQRCILWACHRLGLVDENHMAIVARIAAEVSGKYHPHGDAAAADALYKLGQDWVMRYPLILPEGDFGGPDDSPSAYRYPKAGLSEVGRLVVLVSEMDDGVVEFGPNYDETDRVPIFLPSLFPNLLCNGQMGVGSARAFTSIPHNVVEAAAAIKLVARDPSASTKRILRVMPGPDFPTGGIAFRVNSSGEDGIASYYETGKGTVVVRARVHKVGDPKSGGTKLVVTEMPYGVGREQFIEDVKKRADEFEHIVSIINLSGEGTRIEIELKNGTDASQVLSRLFARTRLQVNVSVDNSFVNVRGDHPSISTRSMREMLGDYVSHRIDMIVRRSTVTLEKHEERLHVLDGLHKAARSIKRVIDIVRASKVRSEAASSLMTQLGITQRQADAILDMRISSLTRLAADEIESERKRLDEECKKLRSILSDPAEQVEVLCREIDEVCSRVGDDRRTTIVDGAPGEEVEDETNGGQVLIISAVRTIKRCSLHEFGVSTSGTFGLDRTSASKVERAIQVSPSDRVLIVDDAGQLYGFDATEVPFAAPDDVGINLRDVCGVGDDGDIVGVFAGDVGSFGDLMLVTMTSGGFVKRTRLDAFSNRRPSGMRAVSPIDGERVVAAEFSSDDATIVVLSESNKACRFEVSTVRPMGVEARGVRAINLPDGGVIGCVLVPNSGMQPDLVAVTAAGRVWRGDVSKVPLSRRDTRGAKLLSSLQDDDRIVGIAAVVPGNGIRYVTNLGRANVVDPWAIRRAGGSDRGTQAIDVKGSSRVARISTVPTTGS